MHSQSRVDRSLLLTIFAGLLALTASSPAALAQAVAAATDSKPAATPAKATPLNVVVTVPPLKSIVEPLLPPGSTITMLMKPGQSEHGYEFTPDDIAKLAKADMVVLVGLALEPRIEETIKRQREAGQATQRVAINWGESLNFQQDPHAYEHHDHGAGCTHGHGWVDQHLWLDPSLVQKFVPTLQESVLKAQRAKLPAGSELSAEEVARVDVAAEQLTTLATQIDLEYRTALEPFKGRAIVCHHDAYGRLAERYGLKVAAAIKSSTASESSPSELANVVKAIREHDAQAVFIEPQFDPSVASRVAKAAGVRVATLDPLGQGDWAATMRSNLQSLTQNLGTAK
jgi:zinc transport system substrate-binding protein